ncbi:hypothetical protein [Thermococcus sibiricus]|uniref:Thymidylate kinase n=1 Tax=Thermococcus sibiricus TaxID=172049 RepID=A0A101EKE0_9EURY|nr:hypothetical protein [Thermococcus sibiricus]KUK17002.1 MAG: Thymidylate kinase [Thermococcus sibiricus]
MKKAKLLCISGIDGSGKTTISRILVKELQGKNKKACYIYGRIIPIFTRIGIFFGKAFILKQSKGAVSKSYKDYEAHKKSFLKNNILLRVLFKYSFLFEQLIQIYIKVVPKILFCDYVILDRYIYDTIITDISPNLEMSSQDALNLTKKYLKFVPKPSMIILIDVPEEIAYRRKTDIPHIDYLKIRRKLYLEVFMGLKEDDTGVPIYIIDGTKDISELILELFTKLEGG